MSRPCGEISVLGLLVGSAVGLVVGIVFIVVSLISGSVGIGRVLGVVSGIAGIGFLIMVTTEIMALINTRQGRGRDRAAAGSLGTVPPPAPSSLRWVCRLLPGDEGTAWWAEVTSTVAEAPDNAAWRRYVRSYQRAALLLIWVSWVEHLNAARQRELS